MMKCTMRASAAAAGFALEDAAGAPAMARAPLVVAPPAQIESWMTTPGVTQPCLIAMVLSTVKPSSASKPFSRPWPLAFTPPKGSSTPPPAP